MKIALCGKMASGKTTIADHLRHIIGHEGGFRIVSMAGEVKRVGRELFGMEEKQSVDRNYQNLGLIIMVNTMP